jgi:hypothetical protein
MKYNPIHRPQRLARKHRWAMLWLRWFVAMLDFLEAFGPPSREARAIGHTWLDKIEMHIVRIIWMRAAPHIEPAVWQIYGPRQRSLGLHRIITGSRLRKLLRSKDLRVRAARLAQNLDALIAIYLRRVRRGLNRLFAIRTRPQAAASLASYPCITPTLIADTS